MKKILLLSTNLAQTPYPVPPLGLALLYQVLQEDYQVSFIDGLCCGKKELADHISAFHPDIIGVSIRNIDDMVKGTAHSFIPEIKSRFIDTIHSCSDAVLILGGSGFTIFPSELMELFQADYGIVGEAEHSLPLLIKALREKTDPLTVKGVIARGNAPVLGSHLSLENACHAEIDTIINYSPYRERGAYPIQTKRGCVHRCIYCSYPVLEGRNFRVRKVEQVVDEIEAAVKRMADPSMVFEFVDSTFNDPPNHAEAICREIIRRKLTLNLRTMGMNPVNISDTLLRLMKHAGFTQIDATPDSASVQMLKNYHKNFTMAHLVEAAQLILHHELPTMWFFIFGGPGETEETIHESFAFIDRYIYRDDMVHITEGLRIYPSTPLAQLARKEGIIEENDSLLLPVFYVSRHLGEAGLSQVIEREVADRPNCIRLTESKPPPELLQAAMRERAEKKLTEPMFRTLLRLKRQMHG